MQQSDVIKFLPIWDHRGNLSVIEGNVHVPFSVERVYYLYDIPAGAERGGHAHKALQQVVIAIAGSFDLILDDGSTRKRVHLDHPAKGCYIGPGVWREMENFAPGSVCLVLASQRYDEADYIRNYDEFLEAVRSSEI